MKLQNQVNMKQESGNRKMQNEEAVVTFYWPTEIPNSWARQTLGLGYQIKEEAEKTKSQEQKSVPDQIASKGEIKSQAESMRIASKGWNQYLRKL